MVYFAQHHFSYLCRFSSWTIWPPWRPVCEARAVLYAATLLMRELLASGALALVLEKYSQATESRKLCLSALQHIS